jgi:hypothetical protein
LSFQKISDLSFPKISDLSFQKISDLSFPKISDLSSPLKPKSQSLQLESQTEVVTLKMEALGASSVESPVSSSGTVPVEVDLIRGAPFGRTVDLHLICCFICIRRGDFPLNYP